MGASTNCRPATVSGSDRAKFFHNPRGNRQTINVCLNVTSPPNACERYDPVETSKKEPFQSVGCQTLYRESSAQTKPFLPQPVVKDGSETPEVMDIVDLIHGDGLPGIHEAEIVERARRRRKCEATLKKSGTDEEWNNRRVMLEAIEWEDWLARENDIEHCQQLRLEIVKNIMNNRHGIIRQNSALKMGSSVKRLEEERDRKLKML